jgi:hypothetical protein
MTQAAGLRHWNLSTAPSSLHRLHDASIEFFIMDGMVAPLVPDMCAERGHHREVQGLVLLKADICTNTGAWVEI